MESLPKFEIEALEIRGNKQISHGLVDLTKAALDGNFNPGLAWKDDKFTGTTEVCMCLSHECRMAAWHGRLYAPGVINAYENFLVKLHDLGGLERARTLYLQTLTKLEVNKFANWLTGAIRSASVVEGEYAFHPIDKTIIAQKRLLDVGIPVGFGGDKAKFVGIDPDVLLDFFEGGGGSAGDFLETTIKAPYKWFTSISDLDLAYRKYQEGFDFLAFTADVASWNAVQSVHPFIINESKIILGDGIMHADAIKWAEDFRISAARLCAGLSS